jgi:hypothetical protein
MHYFEYSELERVSSALHVGGFILCKEPLPSLTRQWGTATASYWVCLLYQTLPVMPVRGIKEYQGNIRQCD